MPASLASVPDPVTVNPMRVEPLAEMVTALPLPPASIIGLPMPLRVSVFGYVDPLVEGAVLHLNDLAWISGIYDRLDAMSRFDIVRGIR